MKPAAGARQRIIERNKYNPIVPPAERVSRVIAENGHTQTYKLKGDMIIDHRGRAMEVSQNGWY